MHLKSLEHQCRTASELLAGLSTWRLRREIWLMTKSVCLIWGMRTVLHRFISLNSTLQRLANTVYSKVKSSFVKGSRTQTQDLTSQEYTSHKRLPEPFTTTAISSATKSCRTARPCTSWLLPAHSPLATALPMMLSMTCLIWSGETGHTC